MVTQVTTVLLTSLGTDWAQSHQGNKIAMLSLFSVIFQKEFLIPSYNYYTAEGTNCGIGVNNANWCIPLSL